MENTNPNNRLPLVGENLSDFEIEIYHENKIKKVKFSDYKEKWLILFFYFPTLFYTLHTLRSRCLGRLAKRRERVVDFV